MGAHRPLPRSLALATLALGLCLPTGCDKLLGGDDDAKPDDAKSEPDEAKAKADAQAEKKAADDAKKKADEDAKKKIEDAKKKADEDATKAAADAKKAADDAKQKADEDAKSRPVNLSDMKIKATGGMFSSSGMIEVVAKAKINQSLGNSTYVHVKALCTKDDQLIADVGYLNAHYSKPLEQYAVGEDAEVKGTLFSQGLKKSLSPCQFEFRVGGIGGGLSVPVGEACWDGSDVADGACDPPLAAVAMSGATKPIEVHELQVEGSGMGSAKGLNLSYLLRINVPQENNARLTFKSACRVGDKSFADLGQANLTAGPFKYESGETVARAANLYWSSSFGFTDTPDDCDITTSLWKTKAGTFGEYEELRLADRCFAEGKLREGRCDPAAPVPPPAAPLVAESVTVDEVKLELTEPYGATGKFQLKIQADVTLEAPVGQNDGVTAKVSCKAGKENRVESAYLFGTELHYLNPKETTRMTASAFGSHALETKPKSCKVEFFGGPRFSPSGSDGVDLGKFCLKKDKVKPGGKC